MGDHLHKAMGWALPSGVDLLNRDHPASRLTMAEHSLWLRSRASRASDEAVRDDIEYEADLLEKSRSVFLDACVLHVPGLDGGTMLITPPTYLSDWHRMDDDLDCAFAEDEPFQNMISYMPSGPVPFNRSWIDALTGRPLQGPAGDAAAKAGTERGDQAALRVRIQGEEAPAFKDPAEARDRIVPGIPREVVDLVKHLGSFLSPEQLLRLRPAKAAWIG